jgi:MYXO-CTERM domain-containing protein
MRGSGRPVVRLLGASLLIFVGLPSGVASGAQDTGRPGDGVEIASGEAASVPAAPAVVEPTATSIDGATSAGVGAGLVILVGAAFVTRRRRAEHPQRSRNRWR